ncbi:MAG: 1-deoxy-D-xylulose-5-phosphate reductoisomerase [Planctomycetota bacterium]|nr:1-deoxy-D-xylulose-5-phosphate reductoisomerase [Planctomycetota bacterium]
MNHQGRQVVVLGSTGSIGRNTLEVIHASGEKLRASGLTAHHQLDRLLLQSQEHLPRWIVASDAETASTHDWDALPDGTELLVGEEGIRQLVREPSVDVVLSAIVGSAGLIGTWEALEAGKTVALANKETLVMAGSLVTRLAAEQGGKIIPVDSEHSAIFQVLQDKGVEQVRRIILTASGGPFREWTREQIKQVTVEDALSHPTWEMGPKITVDSATMMNKALEIIEARWLFDIPVDQIDVVIHPQSLVHSLVEYRDGSTLAQLSPPDMKLPIQYALSYPQRWEGPAELLDWSSSFQLDFSPPDPDRFPALELGRQVARQGGTAGAVLNAANESAVAEFLEGRLEFIHIVPACRAVLEQHDFDPHPSLDRLVQLDHWAREETKKWISR